MPNNRNKPHKILRLITRLNIGGPARQALLLAKKLPDNFETLLAAGNVGPNEGELVDPEVSVTKVPLVRPIDPRDDLIALTKIRRLIDSYNPSIIHTHMAKAGTLGRIAPLTKASSRPKTVHTFHGHVLEGYFSNLKSNMFRYIERQLAKRTDLFIAVSQEIKDQLIDYGIGDEAKIRVVPLGIDLSAYAQLDIASRDQSLAKELGLGPHTPLLGMVGRLVPIKDIPTALRALTNLEDCHLVIAGDGESRASLESLARSMSILDRVHFLGFRDDLANIYAGLDVVLLTSLNEGTPVSLIEAQAAGKPVIASRVGGVTSVIEHDKTGLLVEPADPDGLAIVIRQLLYNKTQRELYGRAGRAKSLANFAETRLVEDITRIYLELLGKDLT